MPTYSYTCSICEKVEDRVSTIANRDVQTPCACGGAVVREEIPSSTQTGADRYFQPKAILGDGSRVPFGPRYRRGGR